MSSPISIGVLDSGLDDEQLRSIVHRRSLRVRAGHLLGRPERVTVGHSLYWPVAIVHASARSAGRRQWVERVQGAVDLVTGRVGLVDVDLPAAEEVAARPERLITPRLTRAQALGAWHEYFRDYVDRRRKPLRPPTLVADRVDTLWLRNRLVTAGSKRLLVDPLVSRVDDLRNYPYAAQFVAPDATSDATPHQHPVHLT